MSELDKDLRELYQDLILDHGKSPRNFQAIEDAKYKAVGHNPLCGDKLVLYLTVGADDKIAKARFQGEGCAISVASASMMTEMLEGKTKKEAQDLWLYFEALCKGQDTGDAIRAGVGEDDLARLDALSGVRQYPIRVKCATLAWRAMEAALDPKNEEHKASTE